MKLYVCWGTSQTKKGHPCANAYEALTDAGHNPTIIRTGGCYRTDPLFPRRRDVKRMTGNYKVPTLELDDGTVIDGSENIVDWVHSNEAASLSK
jgi:Glutathione S-transferase, N-terminal domain